MKISFDIPTVNTEPAMSLRDSVISLTRSVLPSLPSSIYDYVPFILAGFMALLFIALLVLLVEDSDDSQPPRHPYSDTKSSHITQNGQSRRFVKIVDQRKRTSVDDDEDQWDLDAWDPRADLDSNNDRNLKLSQDWIKIQNEKSFSSRNYERRLHPRTLLTSPPASAPAQSQSFTPPMLSMAKLIMYRHDQSTKRSRSASRSSPPPSPPSQGGGSFRQMQYTLKSAVIRSDKLALMALPSESSVSELPVPPSTSAAPASSPSSSSTEESRFSCISDDMMSEVDPVSSNGDIESASASAPASRGRPTRHARSRSITLSLSLPSLPPALQLLQKPSQERPFRNNTSSSLEEGRGSPDTTNEPALLVPVEVSTQ